MMTYELDDVERALMSGVVERARADLNDGKHLTEMRRENFMSVEDKNIGDANSDRKTEQGFTPGLWHVHDGVQASCKCLSISGHGHPIATVERGEWGDSYPSIRRMKDTGSIEGKFEAYIERIPYGEIPESEALANARLIAAAPALYDAPQYVSEVSERQATKEADDSDALNITVTAGWLREVADALALVNKPATESAKRPISARTDDGPASKSESV